MSCAFCQRPIDPDKAVFYHRDGRVWHAGCPTRTPALALPIRLLLELFTPDQIEFDCEVRPPGRPRCGVCWGDRVTLALEAVKVSLNLLEMGAPKPRRSRPLLELVRAVANQVLSDTSPAPSNRGKFCSAGDDSALRSGCNIVVDHDGRSTRCKVCQRKADLRASDLLVASLEAGEKKPTPRFYCGSCQSEVLPGLLGDWPCVRCGKTWFESHLPPNWPARSPAEAAIVATRRCYCGRLGELCVWCQRDHASGKSVEVIRCLEHQVAHQRSHLEGTTEELGPVSLGKN